MQSNGLPLWNPRSVLSFANSPSFPNPFSHGHMADSGLTGAVFGAEFGAVVAVSVASGPLVTRDDAQSCPSRALATKPGWRFTSERNLHDHFQ
jgi:hypothetical protein